MISQDRSLITSTRRLWVFLGPAIIFLVPLVAGWSELPERKTPSGDFLSEYPIADEQGHPLNIIVGAQGEVWFTMPGTNTLGSLVVTSTIDYRFDYYQVPTAASTPYDLAYDFGRDVVWFTEFTGNHLAYFDPELSSFTEYDIPTVGSGPTGVALSPDGLVWFVEQQGNQLASFDPDSVLFAEYPYPEADAELQDIAVANANSLWITAPGVQRVARYVPDSGDFLGFPVNSGPGTEGFIALRVAIGSDPFPWVSAPEMDLVGLLVPGTTSLWRWYGLPASNTSVTGIAYSMVDGRHHIWYTESNNGQVGLLVIGGAGNVIATRRQPLSSTDSLPLSVAVDASQGVWIAEYESKLIAYWQPPYAHDTLLPHISR